MTRPPKNPDGTRTVDGHIFAHNDICIRCGMTLVQYNDGPKPCLGKSEVTKGLTVED
jgi:hypothetical protein